MPACYACRLCGHSLHWGELWTWHGLLPCGVAHLPHLTHHATDNKQAQQTVDSWLGALTQRSLRGTQLSACALRDDTTQHLAESLAYTL